MLDNKVIEYGVKALKINNMPEITYEQLQDGLSGYYCFKNNLIVINKSLAKNAMIETFFHELTHAKQYFAGWLKKIEKDGITYIYWKKNKITHTTRYREKISSITSRLPEEKFKRYLDYPWEIQARSVAANLFNKFNKHA